MALLSAEMNPIIEHPPYGNYTEDQRSLLSTLFQVTSINQLESEIHKLLNTGLTLEQIRYNFQILFPIRNSGSAKNEYHITCLNSMDNPNCFVDIELNRGEQYWKELGNDPVKLEKVYDYMLDDEKLPFCAIASRSSKIRRELFNVIEMETSGNTQASLRALWHRLNESLLCDLRDRMRTIQENFLFLLDGMNHPEVPPVASSAEEEISPVQPTTSPETNQQVTAVEEGRRQALSASLPKVDFQVAASIEGMINSQSNLHLATFGSTSPFEYANFGNPLPSLTIPSADIETETTGKTIKNNEFLDQLTLQNLEAADILLQIHTSEDETVFQFSDQDPVKNSIEKSGRKVHFSDTDSSPVSTELQTPCHGRNLQRR